MFVKLIETLKANPRTLVFTEGADARILEATARLKKDGFLTPILVGVEDEVKAAAAKGGFERGTDKIWTVFCPDFHRPLCQPGLKNIPDLQPVFHKIANGAVVLGISREGQLSDLRLCRHYSSPFLNRMISR